MHNQFVGAVAEARSMDAAEVRKLADGRVYSGAQAKELGLVDQLGNLEDAIELAAKRAGLEDGPPVYHSREEQLYWWERLFMSVVGRGLRGGERSGLRYEWSTSWLQ